MQLGFGYFSYERYFAVLRLLLIIIRTIFSYDLSEYTFLWVQDLTICTGIFIFWT